MKRVMGLLLAMTCLPVLASAQAYSPVPTAHGMIERDPATLHYTMLPMTKGRVEAIDWQQNEMTVSHEHLYDVNLMPGTTIFGVRAVAMLNEFQPGDFIYLVADRRDGRLTLLSLTARHPE